MGKKKSSGIKYLTEEEAFNDLPKLVEAWQKNRHSAGSLRRRYLDMLPEIFRSPRICDFILSNPYTFDIMKEMQFMPFKSFSEDDLMDLIYKHPEIVNIKNIEGEYIFSYKIRLVREIGLLVNSPDFKWMYYVPDQDVIEIAEFNEIPGIKDKLINKIKEIADKPNSEKSAITVFKEDLVPFIKEEVALYKKGSVSIKDIAEASMKKEIPNSSIPQNIEDIEAKTHGSSSPLSNQTKVETMEEQR